MDAEEVASVVAPLGASAERYRDEFLLSAQRHLPLGIPGFKPLGRHWPLDGSAWCGSMSFPLPNAPVFIEGGVRWRQLNRISGLGISSATTGLSGVSESEREGQIFMSKTYEYALGLSIGVKFFKISASLKGSTTVNSFSIRDGNTLDNLYKQALWPILKTRILGSKSNFAMLSSRATEMLDSLRRPGPNADTAATRAEIKEGWLHQLLHRADKEIASVGYEAAPALLQLRQLARELEGVPGDEDVPASPQVLHIGYPLRVMKISDYGFFGSTIDAVKTMWMRRDMPRNNRLTRAQDIMGMLRHLAVRLVYRFTESVARSLLFGPMGPREETLVGRLSGRLYRTFGMQDTSGKKGDPNALFPEINSFADRHVFHWTDAPSSKPKSMRAEAQQNARPWRVIASGFQDFMNGNTGTFVGSKPAGNDKSESTRCKLAPIWFEGAPKSFVRNEMNEFARPGGPDEPPRPEVYGRLLCTLLGIARGLAICRCSAAADRKPVRLMRRKCHR